MAGRQYYASATAVSMLMMMVLMSFSSGVTTQELVITEPTEAQGRQGSSGLSDVDCTGYTFEDLFDHGVALIAGFADTPVDG